MYTFSAIPKTFLLTSRGEETDSHLAFRANSLLRNAPEITDRRSFLIFHLEKFAR